MIHNAIAAGFIKSRFGGSSRGALSKWLIKISQRFTVRISDVHLHAQPIQKTHDLYSNNGTQSAKYIFVYGDPLDSARSVESMVRKLGQDWLQQHLYHLNSSGSFSDLYEKDILNYEAQMQSWMNAPPERVFAIRYDDFWSRRADLSRFVGFEVVLPERREREEKPALMHFNEEMFARLRRIMSECSAKRDAKESKP